MIALRYGRVSLALEPLRPGDGAPLLLLHELRGCAQDWEGAVSAWPGPVYALDFSGHGRSAWLKGGAYSPEGLAGDADCALDRIGPAALAGAGLGAYVALLVAGARPEGVPAALLLPGVGLAGGGAAPDFDADRLELANAARVADVRGGDGAADPRARCLERDVRPPDYARDFAARARRLLFAEDGAARPPWWQAARAGPSAETAPPDLTVSLRQLERGRWST